VKHSDLSDNKLPPIVCFAGSDWWYHNRGHIDMQLMRLFAKETVTLYANTMVMQKLNLSQPL
jgi:hypothetical protein